MNLSFYFEHDYAKDIIIIKRKRKREKEKEKKKKRDLNISKNVMLKSIIKKRILTLLI